MADIAALSNEAGLALGAGIAMGLSALAAAWSQGSLGSAAMGVAAERPEFESKMLIYIVLPEILALLGFAIAFLLWLKIGGAA
jgi:F0F1-type ATP synthase membrane subunit c/vacuolar-type H+-ATPase subunit K